MTGTLLDLGLILSSYLFGALPVVYAIGRLRGLDLRAAGDMHQELWERAGHAEGALGILLDIAKGPLPVLLARGLEREAWMVALAGVAVVAGQMWSPFLRFDGEKGNSTGIGMLVALSPATLALALVPVLAGVVVRTVPRVLERERQRSQRFVLGGAPSLSLPLAMFFAFALAPVFAWRQGEPAAIVWGTALLFALIEVRRLTAGLRADLAGGHPLPSILVNRALFDRGLL